MVNHYFVCQAETTDNTFHGYSQTVGYKADYNHVIYGMYFLDQLFVLCEQPYDFEFEILKDEYLKNDHQAKKVANYTKIDLGLYDICIADLISDKRDTA